MERSSEDVPTEQAPEEGRGHGFDEVLLGGVILLMATCVLLGVAVYLLPEQHVSLAELQPGVRVATEADFPVGTSRVTNAGERIVLVVRRSEDRYVALHGVSPVEGCILAWDVESLRVLSPCSHVVYDLRGNVVDGLTTEPLQTYPVYVREGVVYVEAST